MSFMPETFRSSCIKLLTIG